jgi:hypothetical protein
VDLPLVVVVVQMMQHQHLRVEQEQLAKDMMGVLVEQAQVLGRGPVVVVLQRLVLLGLQPLMVEQEHKIQ